MTLKLSRRHFLGAALTLPFAATAAKAMTSTPNFFNTNGVAINGYDPVAYFTQMDHIEGTDEFTSDWMGVTWRFSSAENKAMFDTDPEAYAPQYGGYCAYAVSKGYTAPTAPNAWTVHNGKLYLNYSRGVRTIWLRDTDGNIAKADANWPGVLG